jgi:membrane peptidoglycan carboxypeptidase
MAGAYATIANKGIYCTPRAIDRVTDANGQEIAPPASSCTQVIAPEVAATVAYDLQGVMGPGGTGAASNPRDGTPMIGKTGTHNTYQTMMIESSTNATTAVWVGNTKGEATLYKRYYNGTELSQLRHKIAPVIARAANAAYGGEDFPKPDVNLTRQMLTGVPNTVGMPVDQARAKLEDAGFTVLVGAAVDSGDPEGIVSRQDPTGGKIAGGSTVTINPSNGQGVSVPDVTGQRPDQALSAIRGAGFGNAAPGTCTEDKSADKAGVVTSTDPAANTVTNRNSQNTDNYSRDTCPLWRPEPVPPSRRWSRRRRPWVPGPLCGVWGSSATCTPSADPTCRCSSRARSRSGCCTSRTCTWHRGSGGSRTGSPPSHPCTPT